MNNLLNATGAMLMSLAVVGAALAQPSPQLAQPKVAEGGKPIMMDARQGVVTVEGFGKVDRAYFYDETITPEQGSGGGGVSELLPPVWHLEAGEALRVRLRNKLDPAGGDCHMFRTNLHTHGLLVAPWTEQDSPYHKLGDYIFADTFPERTPACATVPDPTRPDQPKPSASSAEYEIKLPSAHPSGLFWYHPHPHMLTERQVGGGMAGLIAVGQLWDYAYLHCNLNGPVMACQTPADREQEAAARRQVKERFLMLKDMQVLPHAAPAPAGVAWQYNDSPDAALCGAEPGQPDGRKGSCSGPQGPGPWLFPVNGQLHPQIDVTSAAQVWRIGNTSPDVTYRLALVEGGNTLCMQVLSRDGVAIASAGTGGTDPGNPPDNRVFESEVILMPGSRVELFISYADALNLLPGKQLTVRGTACGHTGAVTSGPVAAEFVTLGFDTGSNAAGAADRVGDPWPAIELAGVTLQPPLVSIAAAGEGSPRMRVIPTLPATPGGAAVPSSVGALRQRLAGDTASQQALRRPDPPDHPPTPPTAKAACGPGQPGTDDSHDARAELGQVRVVWFAVDHKGTTVPSAALDRDPAQASAMLPSAPADGSFELATEIRDASGSRVWPSGPVQLQTFDPERTDVCVRAGHREVWRLVNLSDETHNFHIHQSKFRVLAVHDPYGQLRQGAASALSPDQVHDVYPVPKFGYVDVEIGFGLGAEGDLVGGLAYRPGEVPASVPRPVQVGRFVFHCHILEHEDGGMMGVVEVLPALVQDASSQPP